MTRLATESKASFTDCATRRWPDWSGQTAVCIATGPSLAADQVDRVRRSSVRSIGINDIGLTNEWVDIWYAADWSFWKHYEARASASDALKVCADRDMQKGDICDLFLSVKDDEKAKRFMPGYALHGGHSGFQALQLAISLGANRVILVGYDCKPDGHRTNYFGRKCAALHKQSSFEHWPAHYEALELPPGVEVLNATPGSAIKAFPRVPLDECLP